MAHCSTIMKKALILLVFILTCFTSGAQNISDTIQMQKKLGIIFLQNDKPLTPNQLTDLARPYPLAMKEMKRANANLITGSIFSYLGGFLIGYPIGTAIGGGEPEWAMAAVGAGLVAIAIPFSSGYNMHAKNAVGIINGELKQNAVSEIQFQFGATQNGLGLTLKF